MRVDEIGKTHLCTCSHVKGNLRIFGINFGIVSYQGCPSFLGMLPLPLVVLSVSVTNYRDAERHAVITEFTTLPLKSSTYISRPSREHACSA